MKSVVFAIYFLTTAVSNAISLALAPVSVDPFVLYNYGEMATATQVKLVFMPRAYSWLRGSELHRRGTLLLVVQGLRQG
jgi:hypothetical protein